ncbi:hypothetical protein SMB554_24705 (plasmid) [Sinorhizobium meliloti]|nr:hypothetical protein SMB554_24705 [Sinorhizobium meliloti]
MEVGSEEKFEAPAYKNARASIVQLLRVICLRYIFEIVDEEGQIRAYVASHMYRKANKLIVLHRGAEVGIDICRICDWCAVEENEVQRAGTAQTGWLHDC